MKTSWIDSDKTPVFWKLCWKHMLGQAHFTLQNTIHLLCAILSFPIALPYTWYNSNIAQTTALDHYQQDFEINCSVKERQHPLYFSYYFSQPHFGEKQTNKHQPTSKLVWLSIKTKTKAKNFSKSLTYYKRDKT